MINGQEDSYQRKSNKYLSSPGNTTTKNCDYNKSCVVNILESFWVWKFSTFLHTGILAVLMHPTSVLLKIFVMNYSTQITKASKVLKIVRTVSSCMYLSIHLHCFKLLMLKYSDCNKWI